MMMRNTICVVAVVMAVMFCGLYLMNEDSEDVSALTDGDWTFTVNEDGVTATLTEFNSASIGTITNLIVPSTVSDGTTTYTVTSMQGSMVSSNPYPVVHNVQLANNCTLTLPSSLTVIGDYAFHGCNNLTGNLTIPNSVTAIGDNAFYACRGFTGSLAIPDSVTTIGTSAFYDCRGFTGSLTLGNSVQTIGDNAFNFCNKFTGSLVIPDSATSIGDNAFYQCRGFTSLTLGNSVQTIGDNAFYLCDGFTGSLTLGNSVQTIGDNAFYLCDGFTGSLVIPDSVTTIGNSAFYNCRFTGSLTLGSSLQTIGESAFRGCSGFTGSLAIPNSVTSIGNSAFNTCSGFTGSLTIGNSVITIGEYAFVYCYGFTGSLVIPDSVTTIGKSAFENCTGFTGSLTIGDSVTTIGNNAFNNCHGFAGTLTIGDSVTAIGDKVFNDCRKFTGSLVIPDSATSIGDSAFNDCSGFTSLTLGDSVTTIGTSAFYNCRGFTGSLAIPDSVTTIGNSAFYICYGFTGLTIGNSVTTIGDNAFYNCYGFTGSLTIPDSVTTLGSGAFNYCRGFNGTLTISNSITSLNDNVFNGCMFTGVLEVPYGVTTIGKSAFYNCRGFTTAIFPETVLSIYTSSTQNENSFFNCSNIRTVYDATNLNIQKDTNNGYAGYYATNIYDCHTVTVQTNNSSMGTVSDSSLIVQDGSPLIKNGTVLSSDVPNQSVTAIPTGPQYAFMEWTDSAGNITSDRTVTATFAPFTPTVTIVPNDPNWGTVSESTVTVPYGTTIEVMSYDLIIGSTTVTQNPASEDTGYYYHFLEWRDVPLDGMVTDNITVTAVFYRQPKEVEIRFEPNESMYGTVSSPSALVYYGSTVSISGDTLTISYNDPVAGISNSWSVQALPNPSDARMEYVFSEWNNAPSTITEPITIYANFDTDYVWYTITIQVNNSSYGYVSETTVNTTYGSISGYASGDEGRLTIYGDYSPSVEVTAYPNAPAEYVYTFDRWDNLPPSGMVDDDITVTAVFSATPNMIDVTIGVNDSTYGSVSSTSISVQYGSAISTNSNQITIGPITVTANPSGPTARYTYSFDYWSYSNSTITSSADYITANFNREPVYYTVTFESNNLEYGWVTAPSIDSIEYETAIQISGYAVTIGYSSVVAHANDPDSRYTYSFTGWEVTPQTDKVDQAGIHIVANFTRTLRQYTLTFTSNNSDYGSVSESSLPVYAGTPISYSGNELTVGDTTITANPTASTAYITYSFDNWEGVTSPEVLSNMDIVAHFSREAVPFTWTFSVNNGEYGSVSQPSITVYYDSTYTVTGNEIRVDGQTITATATASNEYYEYTFIGWSGLPEGEGITDNSDIVANFDGTEKLYSVTITARSGGTVSQTGVSVPYNTPVTTSLNELQIGDTRIIATPNDQTAQYTYSFSGWSNVPSNITSNDTTIYANFTPTLRYYEIHFVSSNEEWGTVSIPAGVVPYGATSVVDSQNALNIDGYIVSVSVSDPDERYVYSFSYWSGPDVVTKESTFTAHFVRNVRQYTVTIEPNHEEWGSVAPISVPADYGTEINPVEDKLTIGSTEVKATPHDRTDRYVYVFDKWNNVPADRRVTGNITITADFKQNDRDYEVTITAGAGGTVSDTRVIVPYGTNISYSGSQLNVGSTVIYANADPDTPKFTYSFKQWNNVPQSGIVTDHLSITAEFEPTIRQYTVTVKPNFSDYGSVSPTSVTVDYGTAIIKDGSKLTIGAFEINATPHDWTARYTYTFARWSFTYGANDTEVQQNMTATAVFERTVNQYTVTIEPNYADRGSVTPTSVPVDYGTSINAVEDKLNIGSTEVKATPHDRTDRYVYSFDYWSGLPASNTVVENITVIANFKQSDREYEVTITAGEGGTVTDTRYVVPYGTPINVSGSQLNIGTASVQANPDPDTPKFTYSFKQWNNVPQSGIVTDHLSITAEFEPTIRQYTVTVKPNFSDYGSVSPTSVTVDYGTAIIKDGSKLTIGAFEINATPHDWTARYTYTFARWSFTYGANDTEVQQNMTATAVFERTVNQYTLTFTVNNAEYGSVSPTEVTVDYDTPISVAGDTVTIGDKEVKATPFDRTAMYVYAFDNWTGLPQSGKVEADAPVTANFTRSDRDYEVTITAGAGGTVSTDKVVVPYGTVISVANNKLTIGDTEITATADAETAKYTYTFREWTNVPASGIVDDHLTIGAEFDATIRQYTVTIAPNNAEYGSVSRTEVTVDYDTAIQTSGNTMTIGGFQITADHTDNNAHYTYTFNRWDYTSAVVQGNMDVTAVFDRTVNQYNVTIVPNYDDWGYVSRGSVPVDYGTSIYVDNNGDLKIGDLTVTATPHAMTSDYRYFFVEWEDVPASEQVTEHTTVTAKFDRAERMYEVTISAGNGGTVSKSSVSVRYDTEVSVTGNTIDIGDEHISAIANPRDVQYTYFFREWTNVPMNGRIQTDTTIYAEFDSVVNEYTITIQSNNTNYGTVSESSATVPYGTAIDKSSDTLRIGEKSISATAKEDTAKYDYSFVRWNGPDSVTGNDTVYAEFTATVREYPVTISPDNSYYGSVTLGSTTAKYGTLITTKGADLYLGTVKITANPKSEDAEYVYRFTGWDTPSEVTEDTYITAHFEAIYQKYVVTITATEGGSVSTTEVLVNYNTPVLISGDELQIGAELIKAIPDDRTAKYTYSFVEWQDVPPAIVGKTEIKAVFTATINRYTITFDVNDTQYGYVDERYMDVDYGTVVAVSGATLTIDGQTITAHPYSDRIYTSTFRSWDYPHNITGTTTITANFDRDFTKYNVTIESSNTEYGSVSTSKVIVDAGTALTTDNDRLYVGEREIKATPTQNNYEYTYLFKNWDVQNPLFEGGKIYTDVHVVAEFDRTFTEYTVFFTASDGGLVSVPSIVAYYGAKIIVDGANIQLNNETVTAEPDDEYDTHYTYTFREWTNLPQDNTVTGVTTINAEFDAIPNEYVVNFHVNDPSYGRVQNSVITVPYGTAIIENGAELTIGSELVKAIPTDSDFYYTYTFVRWDNLRPEVDGPMDVTAVFDAEAILYEVTFIPSDSSYGEVTPSKIYVRHGTLITVEDDKLKFGYNVVTARPFDETEKWHYDFVRWENIPESGQITEKTDITAVFTATIREYTVSFDVNQAEFGSVSTNSFLNVPYGTSIIADGDTLTIGDKECKAKATDPTVQYLYKFRGWTGLVPKVEGNTPITAYFTRELQQYTVTFTSDKPYGDWETKDITVPYGTVVRVGQSSVTIGDAVNNVQLDETDQYTTITIDSIDSPYDGIVNGKGTIALHLTRTTSVPALNIVNLEQADREKKEGGEWTLVKVVPILLIVSLIYLVISPRIREDRAYREENDF